MNIEKLFISYGLVDNNFKTYCKFLKLLEAIKNKDMMEIRRDCFNLSDDKILNIIRSKFVELNITFPENIEIFSPSKNYPSHVDNNLKELSYFIPLEEGIFEYNSIKYPIVPFILYSFSDNIIHNTNFTSIMLR